MQLISTVFIIIGVFNAKGRRIAEVNREAVQGKFGMNMDRESVFFVWQVIIRPPTNEVNECCRPKGMCPLGPRSRPVPLRNLESLWARLEEVFMSPRPFPRITVECIVRLSKASDGKEAIRHTEQKPRRGGCLKRHPRVINRRLRRG